jgi:SAM-dependent methyltransferase
MDKKFDDKYYYSYESRSAIRNKGDKPYLYSYWARYFRALKPSGKLLDVGCGLGFFLKRMQNIYDSYGVDVSEYSVEETRKVALKARVHIASATELPFHDDYFDIITAFDIVEHLENPEVFFREASRLLKKDGMLLISTPNPASLGARIKNKTENAKDPNLPSKPSYVWIGCVDKTHITILTPEEWSGIVRRNGFDIVRQGTDFLWDVPYTKYVPYSIQWLILMGLTWILVWLNGLYPWKFGENYVCVARKTKKA